MEERRGEEGRERMLDIHKNGEEVCEMNREVDELEGGSEWHLAYLWFRVPALLRVRQPFIDEWRERGGNGGRDERVEAGEAEVSERVKKKKKEKET